MYLALIKVAVSVLWEGTTVLFMRGQLVMVTAGGALETAIGVGNITNVSALGPYVGGLLGTDN